MRVSNHRVFFHAGLACVALLSLISVSLAQEAQLDNEGFRAKVAACRDAGWLLESLRCTALAHLDTSQVTDMSLVFRGAAPYNGDLSRWNTAKVTTMTGMFEGATSFNGDISTWDTWQVSSMARMFKNAKRFNADISGWHTGRLHVAPEMFMGAGKFNGDISRWVMSGVQDLNYMFFGANSFNGDLSRWDTRSVNSMIFTFFGADHFNADISRWNTARTWNMKSMFTGAVSFNADISLWNTASLLEMDNMFQRATSFNADISRWDVSRVPNFEGVFEQAVAFNADISRWNTASATTMVLMFTNAASFNIDLSKWDISNVREGGFGRMFEGSPKLSFSDVDECLGGGVCMEAHSCSNTDGSFVCLCRPGYVLNARAACDDVNECAAATPGMCPDQQECVNEIGSYRCRTPPPPSNDPGCVSGDLALTVRRGVGHEEAVLVRDIVTGDMVRGLDVLQHPAWCTVEAIGVIADAGDVYGNYTWDHFVLAAGGEVVREHGKFGEKRSGSLYNLITSCPVALDESGNAFTAVDRFCGAGTDAMGWSEYVLLHEAMLFLVQASGAFWFAGGTYKKDADGFMAGVSDLCGTMLACAKDPNDCENFESRASTFLFDYVTDDVQSKAKDCFPQLGTAGVPGSVSYTVTQRHFLSPTAALLCALAGTLVGMSVLGVGYSLHRRRRRRLTPATAANAEGLQAAATAEMVLPTRKESEV